MTRASPLFLLSFAARGGGKQNGGNYYYTFGVLPWRRGRGVRLWGRPNEEALGAFDGNEFLAIKCINIGVFRLENVRLFVLSSKNILS